MGLQQKQYHFFLTDANGRFYYATYNQMGLPVIKKQSTPIPLQYSPADLMKSKLSFATNQKYMSLNRTITYPLKFIKDGADILRWIDYNTKGYESKCYLTVTKLNAATGINELAYKGRIDFSRKQDDPRTGYTVSTLDESAWSILSANENVTYRIDCSPTNPKAVKVLFDGVTLNNRITWQMVEQDCDIPNTPPQLASLPLNVINQDGDSAGVVIASQTYNIVSDHTSKLNTILTTTVADLNVRLSGSFYFERIEDDHAPNNAITFLAIDTLNNVHYLTSSYATINTLIKLSFDETFTVPKGNSLRIIAISATAGVEATLKYRFYLTNITLQTQTVSQPQLCYGLRAFDLLQQIVNEATNGRYSIRSNYFENDNRLDVCFSGDAIRQAPNAYIQSSFQDWFKSFHSRYNLAMRVINGVLWVEPATEVYQEGDILMDLGEISNLTLSPAIEYIANEVKIGSPKQDYRHSNGRYEFNSTNSFSLPVTTVQKSMDLVSKYRFDSYGITFLILDYQGSSSKDNLGDTNVFVARIIDNKASAQTPVETFVNATFDAAPTAPYIRYPFNNAWINNDTPTLRGKTTPSTNVYIYVDHSLAGSTTSDTNGDWVFDITTPLQSLEYTTNPDGTITVIHTGVHIIDATFTDDAGILTSINVTIDTTVTSPVLLTSPDGTTTLYNNKPLLKGVAPSGTTITVQVDGVTVGTTTADGSCLWFYQLGVLSDGDHTININGTNTVLTIMPRGLITFPLITSFAEGFTEVNNLPTIEGVAIPNTPVTVFLNYLTPTILGATTSDAHGNWSITVVPQPYPVNPPIPYIPNGVNVISTSLTNQVVYISTSGYQIDRPAFSEITGVIDNTIFNTWYSPKRMLLAHAPFWKSIFTQQLDGLLQFEAADKNALLKTTLNEITIQENSNVKLSDLSDNALFLPIKAKFKTRVGRTFNSIFYDFNSGGTVQAGYRGNKVYFTPIGSMTQANVTDEIQEWELLLSPKNSLSNIANLSKNSTTLNIMQNAVSISDYNPLHFVAYDFTRDSKYNTFQIYEEWFKDRNQRYITQPDYLQKWQTSDSITVQIVNNGLSDLKLKIYDCYTGLQIDISEFSTISTQPTISPNITLETTIDFSSYGEGEFFFVLCSGDTPIAISERVNVKETWDNTILLECSDTENKPDTFFSTGFKSVLRVEGLVTNFNPEIVTWQNKDELGNNQLLHAIPSKKKTIYFGEAYGVPDYMALKIGLMTQLSTCNIEGLQLVMLEGSKLEPNETDGFPMFYYKLDMEQAKNTTNNVFLGTDGNNATVTLAIDASAFDSAATGVINIELTND